MKYEYKSVFIQSMTASDLTKELNKHGKDGWHLAHLHAQGTSFIVILDRELRTTSAKKGDS